VQVIETKKRVLGLEHPPILTSMANIAWTFWNQGRSKEAEELEVQVLETRKRVLRLRHHSTLTSIANLASGILGSRPAGRGQGAGSVSCGDEQGVAGTWEFRHPD